MMTPRILNPAGRDGAQFRNVAGSLLATELRSVSAGSYAVGDTEATLLCSTMQGPVTITLPRAAASAGRQVTIRKADAGAEPVKIQSVNDEPVAGQVWVSLLTAGEFATFQSDGRAWIALLHF